MKIRKINIFIPKDIKEQRIDPDKEAIIKKLMQVKLINIEGEVASGSIGLYLATRRSDDTIVN